MEFVILSRENYVTSRWAGGTTTQLAICPAGADYAARDFLWRLSSAEVAQEYSVFTSLPDYNRFLGIVEGALFLQTDDEGFFPLPVGQVWGFDGGKRVISQGTCRDFNLMLRKGVCSGEVFSLRVCGERTLAFPEPTKQFSLRGFYCASGRVNCGEASVQAGQTLLSSDCRSAALSGDALIYAFLIESDDKTVLDFRK